MELRKGSVADIADIERIERESFGDAERYDTPLLRLLLGEREFETVVATVDGAVAGYATLFHREGCVSSRIVSMAVEPEHRRRGIGSSLLRELERSAAEKGAERLVLEVGTSNLAAVALYQSVGFRIGGILPGYYGEGKDAYHMDKSVSRS